MTSPILDADAASFEQVVLAASHDHPVVVDFWAAWCGPCRTLGPILERQARADGGRWTLVKVDVDKDPQLAQRFGVQGIPAVFAFRGGQVVDSFTGALPERQVRDWLDRLAPDPAVAQVADGEAALAAGHPARARIAFETALDLRPGLPAALLGLAEVAITEDHPDEARSLLDALDVLPAELDARRTRLRLKLGGGDVVALRRQVEAAPTDHAARFALAHALAAAEDWDGALGELLEIVRRDRSWREDGARKEMLRLFEALGARSPTSERWRDRLARVLY